MKLFKENATMKLNDLNENMLSARRAINRMTPGKDTSSGGKDAVGDALEVVGEVSRNIYNKYFGGLDKKYKDYQFAISENPQDSDKISAALTNYLSAIAGIFTAIKKDVAKNGDSAYNVGEKIKTHFKNASSLLGQSRWSSSFKTEFKDVLEKLK